MTKLRLTYAGYADHCTGQLGDPAFARPIPLMEGVLGFFLRDELRLHSFHIEHFQTFSDWKSLGELLGVEIANKIGEIHAEVSSQEFPELSELSETEMSTALKKSVTCKELEVDWSDDCEVASRLRKIVDDWEAGI